MEFCAELRENFEICPSEISKYIHLTLFLDSAGSNFMRLSDVLNKFQNFKKTYHTLAYRIRKAEVWHT